MTAQADPKTAGGRVRSARLRRGVSLRQAAHQLGLSASTLSACETGTTQMSVARLEQLANYLDVPITHFLTASEADLTGDDRGQRPRAGTDEPAGDWRSYQPLELDAPLAAAIELFVEFGYHGTSIRQIAQRAQLSVPGLYHHFASKQDMLRKIYRLTMDELTARSLGARESGHHPIERFCALTECLALFHTHRRSLGFVGQSEVRSLTPEGRQEFAAARHALQQLMDTEITEARNLGLVDVTSVSDTGRAVSSLCLSISQWYRPGSARTPERIARDHVGHGLDLLRYSGPR